MLRPSELLDTARLLASARDGAPTDADLRRCVSTAYYAVFHAVLTAGADRFFGVARRSEGGYSLIYRSYDHGRMKRSCEEVARNVLPPALQRQLGRAAFHSALRDFANAFVLLQASRHAADYDPTSILDQDDALAVVDRAERAIASFAAAPDDERSDLLALMLGAGRG